MTETEKEIITALASVAGMVSTLGSLQLTVIEILGEELPNLSAAKREVLLKGPAVVRPLLESMREQSEALAAKHGVSL